MLLKKLPGKLGDPGKFLIPCKFPRMDVCHALADLGASINLMPLFIWKKLSLPDLTPTRMTLELADRSITYPKGLAEDVFFKVGKFHFPTDFVVVDFEADPRVPLILRRSFLRAGRALIDSVNRIDIIDAVCEEYALELLGFSNSSGGNPTSMSEPFTSEFILEEIEAYLKDDSISPEIDYADCDPEEDICLIEKLLNNDPFQLPLMDLKSEVTEAKSSIEEPPELELKDLPSHLEYAYLEENDKLPVIIAKGLKNGEKDALLKVLKSHKRAIAWKITDVKGIDPRFCIHKILMEDDYKPMVQSQRRVNPKIHEVIKKEVLKLLDAGMIFSRSLTAHGLVQSIVFQRKEELPLKETVGEKPVPRVYGKSCHLPIELEHKAYWALKHANFDLKTAGDHRKLQLNELNELRDQAYENSLIYKERTKKLHDSKIKNRIFNVGDRVLLFNSRLKIFSIKLKTRWSGPFTITKIFPYGTIELSQPDGPNFKVNGHRVKHYFGGDLPPKVVQDLHTFSKGE
ncbi:reverse transcriptase domain-containing protein [Tanacetum coccineum]|uniref:Reverse transcriptase domain-containing protein n=1 Tax=Tanacetum coccineum TaxID=301880 RepID=A0ABQ5DZB3_9ASTR